MNTTPAETESAALRRYLRRHRGATRITSTLARVEVVRAVLPGGPPAVAHARRQLARLHQVTLDGDLLDRAATLAPTARLRSLDAIHLACALALGSELQALISYDMRLSQAAADVGLVPIAPA